jgi:hypothetical protein
MSDISPVRKNIQVEETRFRAAVSEAFSQKVGSSVNFINTYQKYDKAWFINGKYNLLLIPFDAIDGIFVLPDNALITNAMMFVRQAGSGGSTQLDIKYATAPGGAWTSIFSTPPAITNSAGNYAWCYTGSAFANTTAPVLDVTELEAGWALRCDILAAQTGDARGAGLTLYMQPR